MDRTSCKIIFYGLTVSYANLEFERFEFVLCILLGNGESLLQFTLNVAERIVVYLFLSLCVHSIMRHVYP